MLLALLCHACVIARPFDALTPYFEGATPRQVLTPDAPCPRGTEIRSRSEHGATCSIEDHPDDELVVEFFQNGRLAGYATSTEGAPHGAQRAWHPSGAARETTMWRAGKQHGRHVERARNGDMVLEEHYVDGVRDGTYTRWVGTEKRESGRYLRGLKSGQWEEWVDGRRLVGTYLDGKREGEWEVRERAKPNERADYFVKLAGNRPTGAQEIADTYQGTVGVVDAAWVALALYGHAKRDRRLEAIGTAGLVVSAPLIHQWKQPASDRTEVVQRSWAVRPLSVAGVLLVYTIGKAFAAADFCDSDLENGGGSCSDKKFNKDYNWTGVAIASAISIVAYDVLHAVRRKPAPLDRAWPQVSPMPVPQGGGVSLSGQF